jgi:hypothetical protein
MLSNMPWRHCSPPSTSTTSFNAIIIASRLGSVV